MPVSNTELIGFFLKLEEELQAGDENVADYLPVIRSYVYFSQRPAFSARIVSRDNFRRLNKSFSLVGSFYHVFRALFGRIPQRQLFLAPARHRNTLTADGYASKHLDSLVRVYAGERPLIWEAGPNPNASGAVDSLPRHVWLVATLSARVVPTPGKIKRIEAVVSRVIAQYPVEVDFDLAGLVHHLVAYDLARAYYKQLFRRSGLTTAYVVVYYSFRHAPVISALNELGIETVEYQHGIQNNVHPLYTRWERLDSVPRSLPSRVLVWDKVSEKRIGAWAQDLGIATEIVGNLWCSRPAYRQRTQIPGKAIMVALQIFPDNFNFEILKVIEEMPDRFWILREHPVYPVDVKNREMLQSRCANLEIVGAQDESVEDTLARSFCCITGFSTVGIEALLCGRKTIFTHENARDGLADYIDGEQCFYANTAADILAILADR